MITEYTCVANDSAYPEMTLECKINPLSQKTEWTLFIQHRNIFEGPTAVKLVNRFMEGVVKYGPDKSKYALEEIRESKCAGAYFGTEVLDHIYKLSTIIRKDVLAINKATKNA